MITVSQNGDRVVLDLGGRKRDVLLSPLTAAKLADALDEAAALASRCPPGLFRGEVWGVRCDVFDGNVCLRFTPPTPGSPERVPLPHTVARKLATMVRRNVIWAGYKMKLVVG